MHLPKRVWVTDVGPRDGFQIEKAFIPTDLKVRVVDQLAEAGLPAIEVTSFVNPKRVPQMSDAEAVMARIERRPGTSYQVLVPNQRGVERAIAAQADQVNVVVSASESHNRANLGMSIEQSLQGLEAAIRLATTAGVEAHGGISVAFGCPFEGPVPLDRVISIATRLLSSGVNGITLADTTGMANPREIADVVAAVRAALPGVEIHCHFHNTRGMGLANVLAALGEGVLHFDASLAGMGGCPFAPGATGNIVTEDLVHMLGGMGIQTGIDLGRLLRAARDLEAAIGRPLPGQVMKAGPSSIRHPLPA